MGAGEAHRVRAGVARRRDIGSLLPDGLDGQLSAFCAYPVAILLSALFGGILCCAIATELSASIAWFVFFSTTPPTRHGFIFALVLNGAVISVIGERIPRGAATTQFQ